jgi:hypothetical protein
LGKVADQGQQASKTDEPESANPDRHAGIVCAASNQALDLS